VLNEVELICCIRKYVLLVVLNNLTLSTNIKVSLALKVELRKFSRDDQSEAEKVKEIVRTTTKAGSTTLDSCESTSEHTRRGFRRQRMNSDTELRLTQRGQQSNGHFPAMIPIASHAPVRASAVIEPVGHVNILGNPRTTDWHLEQTSRR
jgi:hypothetical protein